MCMLALNVTHAQYVSLKTSNKSIKTYFKIPKEALKKYFRSDDGFSQWLIDHPLKRKIL